MGRGEMGKRRARDWLAVQGTAGAASEHTDDDDSDDETAELWRGEGGSLGEGGAEIGAVLLVVDGEWLQLLPDHLPGKALERHTLSLCAAVCLVK